MRTCCNHVSLGPPPPRWRAPPISSLVLPAAVPLTTTPGPPDGPPRSGGRSSAPHTTGLASPGRFTLPQHGLFWGWGREVPRRERNSHKWSVSHGAGCLTSRGLGRENMVCRRKSLGHLLGLGLLVCHPLLTVVKSLDVGMTRASAWPGTERLWVSHLTSLSLNTHHFWKSVNLISRLTTDQSNEPVSLSRASTRAILSLRVWHIGNKDCVSATVLGLVSVIIPGGCQHHIPENHPENNPETAAPTLRASPPWFRQRGALI